MPRSVFVYTATLLVFVVGGSASAGTMLYSIVDLGTLGGSFSVAQAINENGHVVGGSRTSGGTGLAFL